MWRRRDNRRNAGVQEIGRYDAEHHADYRQANEESAPLSAQRTVLHHRTGNGTSPYQPKSLTELSG